MPPADGGGDDADITQGHELQIGTNCLGPFLLTKLLLPLLEATAETCGPAEVRVTWAGSIAVEVWSPENGIEFDEAGNVKLFDQEKNYGQSKTGNVFLASEFARRYPASKVVHLVSRYRHGTGSALAKLSRRRPAGMESRQPEDRSATAYEQSPTVYPGTSWHECRLMRDCPSRC